MRFTYLPLIKGRKTNRVLYINNIGLPTSESDWLGMKEKTYLIALVCDLSNINMEKKSLRICITPFVQNYDKQKSLRIVRIVEKKQYSGKPYTVTSDWQKFQMKLHYKLCDEIYHQFKPSV